jgi:glycosyltransferase involved in cell wall biosynthesis
MTADTVGGVWTYALTLANAIRPWGMEVVLATMGGRMTVEQHRQVDGSAVVAVHEGAYALEWMDDPWDDVDRAGDWLLELERELAPDVVHLNGFAHGALPWQAPVVVVGHSCVVSWWEAVHGDDPPPRWYEYRRRVTSGLAAADCVVAPTVAMLKALERAYGTTGGTVIANGRDPVDLPFGAKEPLVLSAGRLWDEAKNVAALDRVAHRLTAPVAIAGAAGAPDSNDRWAPQSAHALGHLSGPELAAWMGRASIFALPARYEPFGLAALEAALAGCALVLGDIPSLREVWGDAARFVAPDDDEAIAAGIQELLDDDELRREVAGRGRRQALRYRPERMAARYVEVYESLGAKVASPA